MINIKNVRRIEHWNRRVCFRLFWKSKLFLTKYCWSIANKWSLFNQCLVFSKDRIYSNCWTMIWCVETTLEYWMAIWVNTRKKRQNRNWTRSLTLWWNVSMKAAKYTYWMKRRTRKSTKAWTKVWFAKYVTRLSNWSWLGNIVSIVSKYRIWRMTWIRIEKMSYRNWSGWIWCKGISNTIYRTW